MTAQRNRLDAHRWHFSHGPIDVIAEAHGDAAAVAAAHAAAWQRFTGVLDELVGELRELRRPIDVARATHAWRSPIAQRMWSACAPFSASFITPMAAVAGAVAQELIACYQHAGIERAWINNGGDIALQLAPGQSVRIGLLADIATFDLRDAGLLVTDGLFDITADMPVRGVATSGWRGRSFSLGIADSVTVLAATAAEADAAATVIGNAVDVVDAGVERKPASECKDDSDLGDIPVTVDVAVLDPAQVKRALDAGAVCARALQHAGHIHAAMLVCQGQWRMVEPLCSDALPIAQPAGRAAMSAVGSVFA